MNARRGNTQETSGDSKHFSLTFRTLEKLGRGEKGTEASSWRNPVGKIGGDNSNLSTPIPKCAQMSERPLFS